MKLAYNGTLPVDSGGPPDKVWEPRFWETGHLGFLDLGI
jgi:hypothetical protein